MSPLLSGQSPRLYIGLLILFLWAACSTLPPSSEVPFVVAIDSAPSQLDPRFATDAYSERIGHLLFSSLIRIGPREEILPDLASRWEVQDQAVTFYLKSDIPFHDGRPLTSDDVRATYASILDPQTASPFQALYEMIETIETPNPSTVRFILKRPHAPFLASLTRGILPKAIARENRPIAYGSAPSALIGSGPFRLVAYQPDQAVELASFENYFEGAPCVPRLVFRIIPDESTRFLETEKGNMDLVQNGFSPDILARLKRDPRFTVATRPSTTYSYLGFNLSDPLLQKPVVREAIARALDKEKMIRYLFQNDVISANSLLTDRHWAYAATKAYPYDPAYAERQLDQAGLRRHLKTGARFSLLYKTSQNDLSRRQAEVIQAQLAKIGIVVTIRSFEWGTFYADIKSGNFQLFSLSWVGVHDPDFYYDLFHSQSMPPKGGNRVRYSNPRVDDLLALGQTTMMQDQRKGIYKEVQEILAEDLPYISLWHLKNTAVLKKEVQGYTVYENGDFYSLKNVTRAPCKPSPS